MKPWIVRAESSDFVDPCSNADGETSCFSGSVESGASGLYKYAELWSEWMLLCTEGAGDVKSGVAFSATLCAADMSIDAVENKWPELKGNFANAG